MAHFELFQKGNNARQNVVRRNTFLSVTAIPQDLLQETETSDAEKYDYSMYSTSELKTQLLDLIPKMTGKDPEENEKVISLINQLEVNYSQTPIQTLDFFNLMVVGKWQLLFSTNQLGRPNPKLRLTRLIQDIQPDSEKKNNGKVSTIAAWDYAQNYEYDPDYYTPPTFDVSGTLSVKSDYSMSSKGAARMETTLKDHELELKKGSQVPPMDKFSEIFSMINKAMPTELFDPSDLAADTTYIDGDVRIMRLTPILPETELSEEGEELEPEASFYKALSEMDEEQRERMLHVVKLDGVRNIFIREGAFETNPVADQ